MGGGNPIKKAGRSVEKFAEDPGRAATAALTMGASEVFRTVKNEAVRELAPDMPDLPNFEDAATNTPTPDDAAKGVADDAAMQEQLGDTRKRGRASTIISGPQGLSGSTSYSARKTLLGV